MHRFDESSQLRTVLRHAEYARDLWAVAPRLAAPNTSVLSENTVINRQRQARGSVENATVSQTDTTRRSTDAAANDHRVHKG